MRPKFSKALLCAGLAAALVGCGGSSNTTVGSMNGTTEPTEPTEPTEADALDRAYETVKSLVDALSADSSSTDFTEAKSARTALLNRLLAVTDVSQEKQNDLNTKLGALKTEIDTKETAMGERVERENREKEEVRVAGLFPKALSNPTLGIIGWPPATTLAGTPTPVDGLPDGWEGMNYDYPRPTTHQKGKTFSMEVEKVTPEITRTWAELAALSQLPDRGELINSYLGGDQIMIVATPTTFTAPNPNPEGLVAGGGVVRQVMAARAGATQYNAPDDSIDAFTPRTDGVNQVYTTQFNVRDFTFMTAADLTSLSAEDRANTLNGTWANAADGSILRLASSAASNQYFVRWKDIPGKLRFIAPSANDIVIVRFHPTTGNLQIVPSNGVFNDSITVSFQPVNRNNLTTPNTTSTHNMDLTLRDGETTTATTEFAYWNSESSSQVTLSTFARGMDFDPVTTMPVALTGEATYNGLAAGYYTMGADSNGEFTAEAMLTADFGTNMIDGSISNFMPMEGDDNLSSWNLALGSASFINNQNTDDTMDDRFMNFMGNTNGGGAMGTWNGQFLGMANPGINLEDAADMTDDYPEAVVGNFTGHFANNGHAVGAFGTELSAADKN